MGMGQGPTSNHTGIPQHEFSKQNGSHQTGLPYQKATRHKGLGPSGSSTPPLVDIQNGSVSNTFPHGSGYSRQGEFGEVTYDNNHAIPSQAGGPGASSKSGNTDATTSPHSKNSAGGDLYPQSTTPVFENHESADVVEEDEEDDNEEEIVPEGQHSVTQEEEDRDGTLVVVSSMGGRGWGKIGKKNGVDVYFNPSTSKWRKLQPTFFSCKQ